MGGISDADGYEWCAEVFIEELAMPRPLTLELAPPLILDLATPITLELAMPLTLER